MDNVETSVVALTVSDDTNTTHVTTTSDHGNSASVELDDVGDLASGKVDLNGVVDLDGGIGVTDPRFPLSLTFSRRDIATGSSLIRLMRKRFLP